MDIASFSLCLVDNCCHFATDHLHDYIHFTIYHLQLHFWCPLGAQAISLKTCTLKLQLLHNTKRLTKWSAHVKMIDPPENFYIRKTFYQRGKLSSSALCSDFLIMPKSLFILGLQALLSYFCHFDTCQHKLTCNFTTALYYSYLILFLPLSLSVPGCHL